MLDRFMEVAALRGAVVLSVASVLFGGVAALGQAQTTQPAAASASRPAGRSHDEMLAQVAKEPLIKEQYRSADGKPLTDDQLAELEKTNALFASAEKSKAAGDYKAATESCDKALTAYRRILGEANHRTVSATILSRILSAATSLSEENQKKLAQAEKAQVDAETAHEHGRYQEAAKAAQEALQTRERFLGKESPEVSASLRVLGNAQIELGLRDQADESLTRALKISEVTFGADHPRTALVLDRLGWLRINQGKPDEAITFLSRAVRTMHSTVGETAELAESLDNAGTALFYLRDLERALSGKLRAYVIREKLLGPESKDVGVSLSNLAWLYSQTGSASKEDVLSLRKRALAIFQRLLGAEHPWTFLEMGNLAREYAVQGNYDEAVKLYQEMISYDQAHADAADTHAMERLIGLGGLYFMDGRSEEGRRTLKQAFDLGTALQGKSDTPSLLIQMDALAGLYQGWRLFEEAAGVDEKAQAWAKKSGQKTDDAAVRRAARLGATYNELGRMEDAQKILEQAVRDANGLPPEDAVKAIGPLLTLSRVYERMGRLEDAERTCDQAMRLSESKVGSKSRAQAYALMTMGRIQTSQKRLDLAKFSLEDAKQIMERSENRRGDPAGMAEVLQSYAACLLAMGDRAQAIDSYRQALTVAREMVEGSNNLNTKTVLASVLKRLGDALRSDLPASQKECDSLRDELKKLLEELREARALSAEQKQWLQELGTAGDKG